jgi:hypothetical protein
MYYSDDQMPLGLVYSNVISVHSGFRIISQVQRRLLNVLRGVGRYITSNLALLIGRSAIFLSKVLYGKNYTNYASFLSRTSPTHHGADCIVLGNRAKELPRNLVLILIQGTSANCIESCKLESNGSSTLVSNMQYLLPFLCIPHPTNPTNPPAWTTPAQKFRSVQSPYSK